MDDQVEENAVRFHLICGKHEASFPLECSNAECSRVQMEAQSPAPKETLNMEKFSEQSVHLRLPSNSAVEYLTFPPY